MQLDKKVSLDLLNINPPALSSTSDMPVIETKPDASNEGKPPALPNEEVKAAPATDKPEASKTPSESATDHTEKSPGEPENKPPRGVQKRLDELARREGEAVRRAEAAEARLDKALQALESRTGVQAEGVKQAIENQDPEPAKPAKTDYSDPETYEAALSAYTDTKAGWIARREVKAKLAEEHKKVADKEVEEGNKAIQAQYATKVEKAREKYDDFDEVAYSPDVHISIPMAQVIMRSEQGSDLQYYLGKNKAEAERISKLPLDMQLVEMGQVLARLKEPAKAPSPTLTQAPKPIKPLGAGSDAAQKSVEEMTMEEYAASRKPSLTRRPGQRV